MKESHVPDSHFGYGTGVYGKECPECKSPMKEMGRDFKPPKRRNVKAWKKLAESGQTFYSCGC
jgi:hypothetical protein